MDAIGAAIRDEVRQLAALGGPDPEEPLCGHADNDDAAPTEEPTTYFCTPSGRFIPLTLADERYERTPSERIVLYADGAHRASNEEADDSAPASPAVSTSFV